MKSKTTTLRIMKTGNSATLLLEFLSENKSVELGTVTNQDADCYYFTVEIKAEPAKAKELKSYINNNLLF